jgi:hypothetical protein
MRVRVLLIRGMMTKMPRALEAKLFMEAKIRGYGPERTRRFVYGTLQRLQRTKRVRARRKVGRGR